MKFPTITTTVGLFLLSLSSLAVTTVSGQETGVCRSVDPNQRGFTLCGNIASPDYGDCTAESTCDTETGYECLCTGSDTPTICGFCQVLTANTINCQVTGQSSTFLPPDSDGVRRTCACEILPGNIVNQTCFTPNPTPPPASLPSALLPTAAPQLIPASPVPSMPPQTTPSVTTTTAAPSMAPQTTPTITTAAPSMAPQIASVSAAPSMAPPITSTTATPSMAPQVMPTSSTPTDAPGGETVPTISTTAPTSSGCRGATNLPLVNLKFVGITCAVSMLAFLH